jgi:formylglycine-generating enzyme required for sulfatase activity
VVAALVILFASKAPAQVVIDTVTVGNPGNVDDIYHEGFGGVDYNYRIGKFEVTAWQYTIFLNSVAVTDTHELYHTLMWSSDFGCKIERSGLPGSYTYKIATDRGDRPVNLVSWGDTARFCNWLHNGQPTGLQDLSTTEDGSYFLNGATTNARLLAVTRKPDATWVIPSEDEWYKAAYHFNDGATNNYYDYPTRSDDVPSNDLINPDPGNNANFYDEGHTLGSPYWRTEVGDFEHSYGPYGTFDQAGNVWEWIEAIIYVQYRGMRGGGTAAIANDLLSTFRGHNTPASENNLVGIRVVLMPARGDFNADGDLDLRDYRQLNTCMSGPGADRFPACSIFDHDRDNEIDLADFAGFQSGFTGRLY